MWFGMNIVPRDGTRFIYLRRVKTVGGGKPPSFSFTLHAMQRDGVSETSEGVWMSGNHSVPDDDMRRGWWTHWLDLNNDGSIKLPEDAFK